MHSFIPGQRVAQTFYNIWSCAFQRIPTRGWSDSPPRLDICRSRIFISTRCNPTPWIFSFYGFSSVSDLGSNSRALICSGGSARSPKLSENLILRFMRDLALRFCPKLLDFSYLVVGSSSYLDSAVLLDIPWYFCLSLNCVHEASTLSEGLLHACEQCPGKYSLWILVLPFFMNQVSTNSLP